MRRQPARAVPRLALRESLTAPQECVKAKPSARSFAEDTGTSGVLISAR